LGGSRVGCRYYGDPPRGGGGANGKEMREKRRGVGDCYLGGELASGRRLRL